MSIGLFNYQDGEIVAKEKKTKKKCCKKFEEKGKRCKACPGRIVEEKTGKKEKKKK
jgi:hypothetical protein